ncbi:hypothetical protein H2198_009260 [Neophaeococcomyces mojaviensis]|uniref:Uncharacterized protein n=1 Tax=Neophaeococcomyces mojaviensis TaxID=3383035 RepID=A0ACC2ZUV2_9EURO|nr:hypothetical protein H2198_009260 [Knufia sp. JES_112]
MAGASSTPLAQNSPHFRWIRARTNVDNPVQFADSNLPAFFKVQQVRYTVFLVQEMARKRGRTPSLDETSPSTPKRQKVTNARLERKRELDRVAQRTIREKTRNHIAYLENLVQTLQAGNESDRKTEKLVAQLGEKNAEINRLRNALNSIVKITDGVRNSSTTSEIVSSTSNDQEETEETSLDTSAMGEGYNNLSEQVPSMSVSLGVPCANDYSQTSFSYRQDEIPNSTSRRISATSLLNTSQCQQVLMENSKDALLASPPDTPAPDLNNALSVSQMASSIVRNTKLEGRLWYLAGTLLNHILKRPQQRLYSVTFDEDIAIRAVIEGWSAVMERYPLDRGWQWLKELDETIYFDTGIPERLMHLRNCRLQFLRQMFPKTDWDQMLPAFFAARPSQRYLDHDPLIEHFPWPTFRERLLFFPRKYATNKFMETLRKNVHFIWGHDSSHLYVKNPCTGMYSYSETFLEHSMDIRCYTVKPAFFDHFPELLEDIPFNNPLPFNILSTYVPTASTMIAIADSEYICDTERVIEEDGESIIDPASS